jgi:hypothetical protein
MTKANFIIEKMQICLDQLGIPLTVVWTPDPSKAIHGELMDKILFIYDSVEEEAWKTLTHEVCEFKFKQVTRPYRLLVNQLIEVVEKLTYQHKEDFLEFLPRLFEAVQDTRKGDLKK